MGHQESSPADLMRLALMEMAEGVAPFREFALGEVAYYRGQGFTDEQAHAMAAAEFTSVFGLRIFTAATENDERPHP